MKTFVINLNTHIENYNNQKSYLEKLGLDVIRFPAINGRENEHLNYPELIDKFALLFTPNSALACGISHILVAQEILKLNLEYCLIMEDDAFPLFEREEFNHQLKETINNINIIDENWDIIQLHSDALFPLYESYFTHGLAGSTAAYLISRRGAMKLAKEKISTHIDIQTSMDKKYKKYRVRRNLFWTNETNSLNRKDSNNIFIKVKEKILRNLIPLRGEKNWEHFLNFKIIKLPFVNLEYTGDQISNYIILYILITQIIKTSLK